MIYAVSLRVLPQVAQVGVSNLLGVNILLIPPVQLLSISHLLHVLFRLMRYDSIMLHVLRASTPRAKHLIFLLKSHFEPILASDVAGLISLIFSTSHIFMISTHSIGDRVSNISIPSLTNRSASFLRVLFAHSPRIPTI